MSEKMLDINDLKGKPIDLDTKQFAHLFVAALTMNHAEGNITNKQMRTLSDMALQVLYGYENASTEATLELVKQSEKAWSETERVFKKLKNGDIEELLELLEKISEKL